MKKHLYLIFIFTVLIFSWEFNKQDLAIASGSNNIPEQAIRLRIIANSDSVEDQILKRRVRDLVTAKIDPSTESISNIDDARILIQQQLPEIKQLVDEAVKESGINYTKQSTVDFGIVPFPTKMYGETVYPAGNYEALRITIGNGEGQNWWCVLFPPLCFVDMTTGDAVSEPNGIVAKSDMNNNPDVEVRFFLVDLFNKIIDIIKSIF